MRIELLQVRNSPVENHCVVSLRKTLYPLLSPGSNHEERTSTKHVRKIVDWGVKQ